MAGTWTQLSNYPDYGVRVDSGVTTVSGKLYLVGGYSGTGGTGDSRMLEYNPATDSWTAKTNLPSAYREHAVCAHSGIIYIIGGGPLGGASATVRTYSPTTDTYGSITAMPVALRAVAAAVVGDYMYVLAGRSDADVPSTEVYRYSFSGGTWSTMGVTTPETFEANTAAVVGSDIYVAGVDNLATRKFYRFRTATTTVETLTYPSGAFAPITGADGKVWFLGNSATYSYTPSGTVTLEGTRGSNYTRAGAATIGDLVYFVTGEQGTVHFPYLWVFSAGLIQEGWGMLI